jgi:small subunit ribosomal protein S7
MYKLLRDKNNEFQCEIKLVGASEKTAKVRLFLEGVGCEYSFGGIIEGTRCRVNMGKLKPYTSLLEIGKIRLEVVADDTLFIPYESTYQLEESKSVTVEVVEPESDSKKPMVEVKSRRVGGANYQVPVEVRPVRRMALSMRWLREAANKRSEKSMPQRLAGELLEAAEGRGGAMKKRDEVHRMAEANKAFSHFRF